MLTESDIKKFAPKAKTEYVVAMLGGLYHLRAAGILESPLRLCHFMAQAAHETGGFTIFRESLNYTTAKRLRKVWPSRFKGKTDAELARLVKNGVALGDEVYMGRMGNDKPGDGYAYRGGGFFQTTGKGAVASYAAKLGLEPSPAMLDDIALTLRFACIEWHEAGCCACADENDILKVSKAINTGSATSNVQPVGLDDRKAWFAKAWAIWGEKGKADQPAKPPMTATEAVVKVGAPVAGAVEVVRHAPIPAPPDVSIVSSWQTAMETVAGFGKYLIANPVMAIVAAGVCIAVFVIPRLKGEA